MLVETSLSSRGTELKNAGGMIDTFKEIFSDPYDADSNPKGFVNLGTAENYIMLGENAEHMNKKLQLSSTDFSYGSGPWGGPRLLKAMSNHINTHFYPHNSVEPEQLHFANGVTSLCDMLGFTICDPGDYVLLSRPIYQAFKMDFGTKARVGCEYVSFGDTDQFGAECVARYEEAILAAKEAGKRIRALMLCNPHNPLGKCYNKDAIIGLMKLCNTHRIHLISDEIYALSVYDVPDRDAVPFTSALSLPISDYIDENYFHHLYGFSKDFAAGGIRLGCCYTRNADVKKALGALSPFGWSGNINERVGCLILEDPDYLKHFLELSKKRLSSNNVLVRKLLDKHGIGYYKGANAGFFMWIDLRPWLPKIGEEVQVPAGVGKPKEGEGWEAENMLTGKLIENKVYVTNGKEMSAEEPGWYRLIFAQDSRAVEEGIERLVKTIKG